MSLGPFDETACVSCRSGRVSADVSPLAEGDPEGFVLRLEQEARVRLNTPSWSGLTHHARACFAIPEERIEEALVRMERALGGGKAG